jgi:hypothetical protein
LFREFGWFPPVVRNSFAEFPARTFQLRGWYRPVFRFPFRKELFKRLVPKPR